MDPFLTLALFTAAKPRRSRSSQPKARGALVASGVGQGCLEVSVTKGCLVTRATVFSSGGPAHGCLQDICFLKETELSELVPRKELAC